MCQCVKLVSVAGKMCQRLKLVSVASWICQRLKLVSVASRMCQCVKLVSVANRVCQRVKLVSVAQLDMSACEACLCCQRLKFVLVCRQLELRTMSIGWSVARLANRLGTDTKERKHDRLFIMIKSEIIIGRGRGS